MKALDGRHRWEVILKTGARTTHRCRVCGQTQTFEHMVPEIFLKAMLDNLRRPNPYRALR